MYNVNHTKYSSSNFQKHRSRMSSSCESIILRQLFGCSRYWNTYHQFSILTLNKLNFWNLSYFKKILCNKVSRLLVRYLPPEHMCYPYTYLPPFCQYVFIMLMYFWISTIRVIKIVIPRMHKHML